MRYFYVLSGAQAKQAYLTALKLEPNHELTLVAMREMDRARKVHYSLTGFPHLQLSAQLGASLPVLCFFAFSLILPHSLNSVA